MEYRRSFTSHCRASGFTLIELLVVMAIVTMLASLLFAVFSRVREKGRSTVCQSNLKQIASAMQLYIQDSDGKFPPTSYSLSPTQSMNWADLIAPYSKSPNVFICPTSKLRTIYPNEDDYAYNAKQLNALIYTPGNLYPQRIGRHESQVLQASSVALNFDNATVYSNEVVGINGIMVESACGPQLVPTLHSGGANWSFIDGHVKWLSQAQQVDAICAWDTE